jgi:hypothetical protein
VCPNFATRQIFIHICSCVYKQLSVGHEFIVLGATDSVIKYTILISTAVYLLANSCGSRKDSRGSDFDKDVMTLTEPDATN